MSDERPDQMTQGTGAVQPPADGAESAEGADAGGSRVTPEVHRRLATDALDRARSLMELPRRAPEQDDELIHLAHASRHHWGVVGTPVHRARGEWQVSRVYALLGRAEPARFHAQRCLDLCLEHGIGGRDLAFAHEALARAAAVDGDGSAMQQQLALATAATGDIEDADERSVVEADLATVPAALVP